MPRESFIKPSDDPFAVTWARLQAVLDQYEQCTPRAVREAGFAMPMMTGFLAVAETVNHRDLDSPSYYRVFGGDNRDAEWGLYPGDGHIEYGPELIPDDAAYAALHVELDKYVNPRNAATFQNYFGR